MEFDGEYMLIYTNYTYLSDRVPIYTFNEETASDLLNSDETFNLFELLEQNTELNTSVPLKVNRLGEYKVSVQAFNAYNNIFTNESDKTYTVYSTPINIEKIRASNNHHAMKILKLLGVNNNNSNNNSYNNQNNISNNNPNFIQLPMSLNNNKMNNPGFYMANNNYPNFIPNNMCSRFDFTNNNYPNNNSGINNYYTNNQTCTNFLAARDIIKNIFNIKVLDYNIDLNNKDSLKKGLFKIAGSLNIDKKIISSSYINSYNKYLKSKKETIKKNIKKLNSARKKVLIISHSYNTYDDLIGIPIINMLKKEDIEIIYCNQFDTDKCIKLCERNYKDIYWKYSKEMIGAYEICKNKIDGVILISTFPCGLDSLANELLILNLKLPYLNIIIDDVNGNNGIETRIESFIDILKSYS